MTESRADRGQISGAGRDVIRAAGGLLWRPVSGSDVEVAVIHRPKHNDWTLPKGKLDPGETELDAALREVEEETGYAVALGQPLGDTQYVSNERPKVVRYWAMTPREGTFAPSDEVDELRWLAPARAVALLTYDRDRDVLERFLTGSSREGTG